MNRKCTTTLLRGEQGVLAKCGRRAHFTVLAPWTDEPEYLCGIHANVAARDGFKVLEGVWVREG